jgi:hypothetical protein
MCSGSRQRQDTRGRTNGYLRRRIREPVSKSTFETAMCPLAEDIPPETWLMSLTMSRLRPIEKESNCAWSAYQLSICQSR